MHLFGAWGQHVVAVRSTVQRWTGTDVSCQRPRVCRVESRRVVDDGVFLPARIGRQGCKPVQESSARRLRSRRPCS